MYCLLLYAVLSGSAVGSSALHTVSGGSTDSLSGCSVGEQGNGFGQPQAKGGITHKPRHWAAAVPSMEGAAGAGQSPKYPSCPQTPHPAAAPQTNHTLKTGRWVEVEGAVCVRVSACGTAELFTGKSRAQIQQTDLACCCLATCLVVSHEGA